MTELTHFYITLGFVLLSGGLGYYVGGRTIRGVKVDIDNIKNDIERFKNAIYPQSKAKVATTVGSTKATDTVTVTTTPNK